MKKVAFYIARYSRSGVPLAQIRLAKAFYRRGYKVDFLVGFIPDGVEMPEIKGVGVTVLDQPRTYKLLFPIVTHIRKIRPDVIFTAEDHLNAIVTIAALMTRSKAKLSASSRVTPYDTYSNKIFSKRWFLKIASTILRKRVDALVCVSKDMVGQYETIFGSSRYECIYNIVVDSKTPELLKGSVDDPWFVDSTVPIIITAGRLSPEKGFFDLIDAMKLVTQTITARLVILGEGPLHEGLVARIAELSLTESVRLLGFKENPLKYFSQSRVFVLSSYVEGLPNVLVEAMASGCTPVATNCPTGPREVLRDGEYGYLVPMRDPEAMAAAIIKALEHPMTSEQLKEAVEPFTEERVIEKHRSVLGF